MKADTFAIPGSSAPTPRELEDHIAATWEILLEQWETVRANLRKLDLPMARRRWMLPLLQALYFEPQYQQAHVAAGELRFDISHRGWPDDRAPMLHLVAPTQGLDDRSADRRGARSPHDTVQEFLNAATDRWAVVTNGALLRLLRDFHHTYTKGFVEFDLEGIFETKSFSDFRALYRMCHASRFVPDSDGKAVLERFYETSIATGVQAGAALRGNVIHAIETLANGFLSGELIAQLQSDAGACRDFYAEVLTVVYRLLFLLFAEQRGMMPGRSSLYAEEYSVTALRERAEAAIPARDDHADLWARFLVTCRMVREGVPELDIFGYNGELFADLDDRAARLGKRSTIADRLCRNAELLQAIRHLTLIEKEGVLQRVSYADLGVEELGSIYESLLDYTPRVTAGPETPNGREVPGNRFFLDSRGSARKTSGSYYTHPSLVNALVESALVPVLEERLSEAVGDHAWTGVGGGRQSDALGAELVIRRWGEATPGQRDQAEQALLRFTVCDPACGSGAFLTAATNTLGLELARIRTGDEYPAEGEMRRGRRDVLAHCIYGVDLNPMAVELCKVSLWIDACVSDLPLNFLDHHIKAGNSLVGATPELLAKGIPDEAFTPVEGDNKAIATQTRKRNKTERLGQAPLAFPEGAPKLGNLADEYHKLVDIPEADHDGVELKAREYARLVASTPYQNARLWADMWCAAFFWPLDGSMADYPTDNEFRRLEQSPHAVRKSLLGEVERLAAEHRFFHWHLEFPDVFARGGFDCMLGNPPWEVVEPTEMAFFSERLAEIADAPNSAARSRLIKTLEQEGSPLHAEFRAAAVAGQRERGFATHSGKFPLGARGRVNTYALFAETFLRMVGHRGRSGFIVPTGFATDSTTSEMFSQIAQTHRLAALYSLVNERKLFPGVHHAFRFSLVVLTGVQSTRGCADLVAGAWTISDAQEEWRRYRLSPDEMALLNPNTGNCPLLASGREAVITVRAYRACPVLVDEGGGDHGNPWGLSFKQGLFNMSSDSAIFRTEEQLLEDGFALGEDGRFLRDRETWLPLYEGKMIYLYDHRAGQTVPVERVQFRRFWSEKSTTEMHEDPWFVPSPTYWVPEVEVEANLPEGYLRHWFVGFRDITNSTNERTVITSVLPRAGVGHPIPLVFCSAATAESPAEALILSNMASLVLDYFARQKVGGSHLTFFILKQLPVIPLGTYERELGGASLASWVSRRTLELSYTAWDLRPFAEDLGYDGPPFRWDEARRLHLMRQLDAMYAHLYGLTRDEFDYILDTFPVMRKYEERDFGEYRTKRLALAYYDAYAEEDWEHSAV